MKEYRKNLFRFGFVFALTFPIIYNMGWNQVMRVAYKSALALIFLALAEASFIFYFKLTHKKDTAYDTWQLVTIRCTLYAAFILGGCLGL